MKKSTVYKLIVAIMLAFVVLAAGTGYYFSNILILKDNAKVYAANPEKTKVVEDYKAMVADMNGSKITVKSPYGYDLVGTYFPAAEKTNRTMIVVHGYTNAKEDQKRYIEMFHEMGNNVVAYDHRNHGESGGDFTTYGILESMDLQAVVKYVKDMQGEDGVLGIHGLSMGAATTLQYAGEVEDGADFYIADCAFSNFADEARFQLKTDYGFIPKFLQEPIILLGDSFLKMRKGYSIEDAAPIDVVQNIKSPVLFINTKTDDYIPPYMTQDLYDKKVGEKEIYWTETGLHAKAYEVDPAQYKKMVSEFVDKVTKDK